MTNEFITCSVEGNIASGKTSLLKLLSKNISCEIFEEPVESWKNVAEINLFEELNKNPKKNAFQFQMLILNDMLKTHAIRPNTRFKFMERSIHSSKIFIEHLKCNNNISKSEIEIHNRWLETCTNIPVFNTKLDYIFYLKTDPAVAYKRLVKRNRNEEKSMTFLNIKTLHEIYETKIMDLTSKNTKLIILDGEKPTSELCELLSDWIKHVQT